jgi:hypothetical protein
MFKCGFVRSNFFFAMFALVSSWNRLRHQQGESQPPNGASPSPGSGGWTRTTDTAIMSRLLYL